MRNPNNAGLIGAWNIFRQVSATNKTLVDTAKLGSTGVAQNYDAAKTHVFLGLVAKFAYLLGTVPFDKYSDKFVHTGPFCNGAGLGTAASV